MELAHIITTAASMVAAVCNVIRMELLYRWYVVKKSKQPQVAVQKDAGTRIEIREIELIPADTDILLLFTMVQLKREDVDLLEESLNRKTGKKCVVVDGKIRKIAGIKAGRVKGGTVQL